MLRKGCEKFRFFYKRCNKNMLAYQQLVIDIIPTDCNLIKIEIPAEVFSCEFCEFYQPATIFKRFQCRCFSVNFAKF